MTNFNIQSITKNKNSFPVVRLKSIVKSHKGLKHIICKRQIIFFESITQLMVVELENLTSILDTRFCILRKTIEYYKGIDVKMIGQYHLNYSFFFWVFTLYYTPYIKNT